MPETEITIVFIHVYHSKAWLLHDYRENLETNINTTITGAATRDPLFEPDPNHRNSFVLNVVLYEIYRARATTLST